jgi:ABC-type lipoprotein release transport system permease subunit
VLEWAADHRAELATDWELGAALAAARMVGTFLIASPTDPMVYVVVSAVLTFVAMLACLVPGWKAIRTDPIVALRSE